MIFNVSCAQQSCIYLFKNTVKLWNIIVIYNSCFLCEYVLNCNLFLWSKLYFQHHYCSLQCHMIFRNHNNMLICCSRNISDYYQCWKQLCCTIFLLKLWCILFFRIHRWIESSKEQHLFEIEAFCNIINVFTVTFEQFNASTLIKINKYWPQTLGCTIVSNKTSMMIKILDPFKTLNRIQNILWF